MKTVTLMLFAFCCLCLGGCKKGEDAKKNAPQGDGLAGQIVNEMAKNKEFVKVITGVVQTEVKDLAKSKELNELKERVVVLENAGKEKGKGTPKTDPATGKPKDLSVTETTEEIEKEFIKLLGEKWGLLDRRRREESLERYRKEVEKAVLESDPILQKQRDEFRTRVLEAMGILEKKFPETRPIVDPPKKKDLSKGVSPGDASSKIQLAESHYKFSEKEKERRRVIWEAARFQQRTLLQRNLLFFWGGWNPMVDMDLLIFDQSTHLLRAKREEVLMATK